MVTYSTIRQHISILQNPWKKRVSNVNAANLKLNNNLNNKSLILSENHKFLQNLNNINTKYDHIVESYVRYS